MRTTERHSPDTSDLPLFEIPSSAFRVAPDAEHNLRRFLFEYKIGTHTHSTVFLASEDEDEGPDEEPSEANNSNSPRWMLLNQLVD